MGMVVQTQSRIDKEKDHGHHSNQERSSMCIRTIASRVAILIALTFAASGLAQAASSLGAYNVNPNTVTVAGISSGGYMAVQLQVAYSSHFYGTAVIAGAIDALTHLYHLSDRTQGFTVFIAVAGTVVGAMFAGSIGQKIGGRETLRITAVFYVISALGCALAWNWPS